MYLLNTFNANHVVFHAAPFFSNFHTVSPKLKTCSTEKNICVQTRSNVFIFNYPVSTNVWQECFFEKQGLLPRRLPRIYYLVMRELQLWELQPYIICYFIIKHDHDSKLDLEVYFSRTNSNNIKNDTTNKVNYFSRPRRGSFPSSPWYCVR